MAVETKKMKKVNFGKVYVRQRRITDECSWKFNENYFYESQT